MGIMGSFRESNERIIGGKTGIPYFRDQTPRLLFISSHDLLRLLFKGGV